MRFHFVLTLHAVWTGICQAAMHHYPAAWGHYDVCKSQIFSDEGLTWDYTACQPEAADMTHYLKVTLDPPNITCGDPPETYCALVSTQKSKTLLSRKIQKKEIRQLSYWFLVLCMCLACSDPTAMTDTLISLYGSDMPVWLKKWEFVHIDVMICCLESCFLVCTANTV